MHDLNARQNVMRLLMLGSMLFCILTVDACGSGNISPLPKPNVGANGHGPTLAAPSAEKLYVPNSANDTITVYDQDGHQIPTSGAFPNSLGPEGIAFDPVNGYLYVTIQHNFSPPVISGVAVYDRNGNQITPSGTFPNLAGPTGIAFDAADGRFYVTNTGNNTITVYDPNGNQLTPSGSFANLDLPQGIVFDQVNGYLYVANSGNNTITVYDQNGSQIALSGNFPNLNGPIGIAFDSVNDDFYVANFGNCNSIPCVSGSITVYDQNGRQITSCGAFPNTNFPVGIAFNPANNHFYVTNSNNTITVYDPNGNQIVPSGSFPNLVKPALLTTAP